MTGQAAFRYWLFALALCTAAVGFCIAFVDRPLALFFDEHIRQTELWAWLDLVLRPFPLIIPVSVVFMFACSAWLLSGHQLRAWAETSFLCSCSAIAAGASDLVLKHIFGRGWPDPTFIQDHLYGFHLLHGEKHWDAYPSGTTGVSVAILAVLWILRSRWRFPGLAIVIFLIAAVVVMNYHWLSDVIARAFLGVWIGWSTVRWLRLLCCSTGGKRDARG
jgi:membrane-associated phospholipid phosphatase